MLRHDTKAVLEDLLERQCSALEGRPDEDRYRLKATYNLGDLERCVVLDGYSSDFISDCYEALGNAGRDLGCPSGVDPVKFFIRQLALDLRNSPHASIRQDIVGTDVGQFQCLLGAAKRYYSRLVGRFGYLEEAEPAHTATVELQANPTLTPSGKRNIGDPLRPDGRPPRSEPQATPYHSKAPAFTYRYPSDFPAPEQRAIETARLEANRKLEDEERSSYHEHKALRIEWFWSIVSAAAVSLGRTGAAQLWDANRMRDTLDDFASNAARAARLNHAALSELMKSAEWRELEESLFAHETPAPAQKPMGALAFISEAMNRESLNVPTLTGKIQALLKRKRVPRLKVDRTTIFRIVNGQTTIPESRAEGCSD